MFTTSANTARAEAKVEMLEEQWVALEARYYSIDSVNRPVAASTCDRTQAGNGTDYVENVAVIIAKSA